MATSILRFDALRSHSKVHSLGPAQPRIQSSPQTRSRSQPQQSPSLPFISAIGKEDTSNTNRKSDAVASLAQAIVELRKSLREAGVCEVELRRRWTTLVELFESIKRIEADMNRDKGLADRVDALCEGEEEDALTGAVPAVAMLGQLRIKAGDTISGNTRLGKEEGGHVERKMGRGALIEEEEEEEEEEEQKQKQEPENGRKTSSRRVGELADQRSILHSNGQSFNDFGFSTSPPSSKNSSSNQSLIIKSDTIQDYIFHELQLSSTEIELIIRVTYRTNYDDLKKDIKILVDKVVMMLELGGWWELYFWWGREIVGSRKGMRLVSRIVKMRNKKGVKAKMIKGKGVEGHKDNLMTISVQDLHKAFNAAKKKRRSRQGISKNSNVFTLEDVKKTYDDLMMKDENDGELVKRVDVNEKENDEGESVKSMIEDENRDQNEIEDMEDEDENEDQNRKHMDTHSNNSFHATDNFNPDITAATINNNINNNAENEAGRSCFTEDGYKAPMNLDTDEDDGSDDISLPEISRHALRTTTSDLQPGYSSDIEINLSPLQQRVPLTDIKNFNNRRPRRRRAISPSYPYDPGESIHHQSIDKDSFRFDESEEELLTEELNIGLADEREWLKEIRTLGVRNTNSMHGKGGRREDEAIQSSIERHDKVQLGEEKVPSLMIRNSQLRDGDGRGNGEEKVQNKMTTVLPGNRPDYIEISSDSDPESSLSEPTAWIYRPISTDQLLPQISEPTEWTDEILQYILSTFVVPKDTLVLHPLAINLENPTFYLERYWKFERIIGAIFHPREGSLRKGGSEKGAAMHEDLNSKEGDKKTSLGHWTLVVVEPWQNCWKHFDSITSKARYERVEVMMKGWMGRQLEQRKQQEMNISRRRWRDSVIDEGSATGVNIHTGGNCTNNNLSSNLSNDGTVATAIAPKTSMKSSTGKPLKIEDSLPFRSPLITTPSSNQQQQQQQQQQQRFSPSSSIFGRNVECMQQSDGVSCGFFVAAFCWWIVQGATESEFLWFDVVHMRQLLMLWVQLMEGRSNGYSKVEVKVEGEVEKKRDIEEGTLKVPAQEAIEKLEKHIDVSRHNAFISYNNRYGHRDEYRLDADGSKQDVGENWKANMKEFVMENGVAEKGVGDEILAGTSTFSASLGPQLGTRQTSTSSSFTQHKQLQHVQSNLGLKWTNNICVKKEQEQMRTEARGDGNFCDAHTKIRGISQVQFSSGDGTESRAKIKDALSMIGTSNTNTSTGKRANNADSLSTWETATALARGSVRNANKNVDGMKEQIEGVKVAKESEDANLADDSNLRDLMNSMNTAKRKYDEFLKENKEEVKTLTDEITVNREKVGGVRVVMEQWNNEAKERMQVIQALRERREVKWKVLGRFTGFGEEKGEWRSDISSLKENEEDEVAKEVGEIKREMERAVKAKLEKEINDISEKIGGINNEILGFEMEIVKAKESIKKLENGVKESEGKLRLINGRVGEAKGWIKRVINGE